MALKKEFGKQVVADLERRELRKDGSGPMKKYSVFLPADMVADFKAFYLETRGLSLSSGIRLAVGEFMENLKTST